MLLTRAPVAGGGAQGTSPLPLDLHVLSLPLAFILSQDQTLRCYYMISFYLSVCLSVAAPSYDVWMFDGDYIVSLVSLLGHPSGILPGQSPGPPSRTSLSCGIMSSFSVAASSPELSPSVVSDSGCKITSKHTPSPNPCIPEDPKGNTGPTYRAVYQPN